MPILSGKPWHGDDICIWPEDTYCDARELEQYQHMSDDYIRLPVDTAVWLRFVNSDRNPLTYDEVVAAIRDELEAADHGG